MESNVYIATTRKHLASGGLKYPRLSWGVKTSLPCSVHQTLSRVAVGKGSGYARLVPAGQMEVLHLQELCAIYVCTGGNNEHCPVCDVTLVL